MQLRISCEGIELLLADGTTDGELEWHEITNWVETPTVKVAIEVSTTLHLLGVA